MTHPVDAGVDHLEECAELEHNEVMRPPELVDAMLEAASTLGILATSAGNGLRSSLRLEAIKRRASRARGVDVAELELVAELNEKRAIAKLAPLETLTTSRGEAQEAARATAIEWAASSALSDPPPEGRVPPSLESIGITDLDSSATSGPQALHLDDSDPYMKAVEAETAAFRIGRARNFHRRANAIAARKLLEALPPELEEGCPTLEEPASEPAPHTPLEALTMTEERRQRAAWHSSRAKGTLERFPRVRDCGMKKSNAAKSSKAVATCARSCGLVRKIDLGCGVGRLCLECRAAAATFRKERFDDARSRVVKRLRRDGLMNRRRVGYWRERFLTLTAPHVDVDQIEGGREACESKGIGASAMSVAARIALVREAWRYFSISLQAWARGVRKAVKKRASVCWYRAFEWTPGSEQARTAGDFFGHPHFHLWIVCPELPQALVKEWWAKALERAGAPACSPVVDIRDWTMPTAELVKGEKAIKGQRPTIAQYVEGWSIVDMVDGAQIGADVAARLYEALDGARLVQTSRNLLSRIIHLCPACGCHGSTDVRIVEPDCLELVALAPSRGPPLPSPWQSC